MRIETDASFVGGSALIAAPRSSTGAGVEAEGHPHLGLVVVAGAELERLGERRDERQAEAEAGAVGARQDAAPLVDDHDAQDAVVHRRAQA